MEKSQEPRQSDSTLNPKLIIALKIATTVVRVFLFFFDLWSQQFHLSKVVISVPIAVSILAAAEATVWYRIYKSDMPVEVNIPATICAHLWGFFNVVLCSITITPDNIDPTFSFFSVCFGELMNYLITGVGVYMILYHPVLRSFSDFLPIYEPIHKAIPSMFMAVYVGSYLDLFTFSGPAVFQFYLLTGILLLYQLIKLVISNWLKDIAKVFFVE